MLKKREGERERVKLSTYLRPSYLTVDRSEKILPITLGQNNFATFGHYLLRNERNNNVCEDISSRFSIDFQ